MTPGLPGGTAQPFHDILDGYFTLRESMRQLMARHRLGWAWLVLRHAPVMEIAGLAPDAPVPLHLRDGHAGLIDTLLLTAVAPGPAGGATPPGPTAGGPGAIPDGTPLLSGTGSWRWLDARRDTALPADIRLAEPAYVTGFGLGPVQAAKRIDADEVLADLPALMAEADNFHPFAA